MMRALYDRTRVYDAVLSKVIGRIRFALDEKDDDFLILCCGSTGTGKSSLMLHVIEEYLGDGASVDYVGLDKADFANALDMCNKKELPRFCANDEANISKRDSLSKYNKDLIDLYLSIRGLRIFHWWNNPSLDMIDKHFIEERIKGVIYIHTKDVGKPRLYYYFRKTDLLKAWEKYENLKLTTLKKIRKTHSYYRGWFRKYDGKLWKPYQEKKESRMNFKVEDFNKKYGLNGGKKFIKLSEFAKRLFLNPQSIKKYGDKLLKEGKINEEDVRLSPTGRWFYSEHLIPIFKNYVTDTYKEYDNRFKKNETKN